MTPIFILNKFIILQFNIKDKNHSPNRKLKNYFIQYKISIQKQSSISQFRLTFK